MAQYRAEDCKVISRDRDRVVDEKSTSEEATQEAARRNRNYEAQDRAFLGWWNSG